MCDGYMQIGEDGKKWRYIVVQCSCPDKTEWETRVYGLGTNTTSCGCASGRLVADAQREPVKKGTTWKGPKATLTALCDGYYVYDAKYQTSKQWVRVRCSCGNKKPVLVSTLQPTPRIQSCGCVHSEQTSAMNVKRNSRDGFRGLTRWIYRSGRKVKAMMSVWELAVAHHFDAKGIKWVYERKWFKLGEGVRYLPDFYLPKTDEWYEVKADWGDRLAEFEKTKARSFRRLGKKLTLLTDENKRVQKFVGLSDYAMRKMYGHCHWIYLRSKKAWSHKVCGTLVKHEEAAMRRLRWRCPECDK